MLSDVIEYLICPACSSDLAISDRAVSCERGHSYDVAQQGYINLIPGGAQAARGDTAMMIEARAEFLGRGHFSPLAQSLAEEAAHAARAVTEGCLVDVGAGTGYYLARILDAAPERPGLALDASKYAARRAARAHDRAGAVVCDAWTRLPVRSGATAVAVNIFAPRNSEELHRILSPRGRLIVVTPSRKHLVQLVAALGLVTVDELKEKRLEQKLSERFSLEHRTQLEFPIALPRRDVESLVAMGPSARHTNPDEMARRIGDLPEPVAVTASVALSVYEPR